MTGPETLETLRDALRAFAAERDWDQFHSPKNLAMSVMIEAAELGEHFQWLPTGQDAELAPGQRDRVALEMADVLLYLVRLADRLDIDLAAAARRKLDINAERYPADRARGRATKYTEL
jgi:dCTP diphosphatase